MRGKLATATSGHDKGTVYVVMKEEETVVYLSDGRLKPVEHPKRKNRKHIQIIKELPPQVAELLAQDKEFSNEEIKRAIKLYNRR
jgi:ribosomal protein L14E/L6E/L27E